MKETMAHGVKSSAGKFCPQKPGFILSGHSDYMQIAATEHSHRFLKAQNCSNSSSDLG